MRQIRLALVAGAGVLLLCVLALVISLADYTSHPAVASAHVPPVVGTPPGATDAPSPVPTVPVTTVAVDPTPQPTGEPGRGRDGQLSLAQILQQLQQRHHHFPTPRPRG